KHIRPHRTCLGMMKMISDSTLSCDLPTDHGLDLGLFRQLNSFAASKGAKLLGTEKVDDATARALNDHYKAIRKSISASDYERICKGTPAAADPIYCVIDKCDEEDAEGGKVFVCKIKGKEADNFF